MYLSLHSLVFCVLQKILRTRKRIHQSLHAVPIAVDKETSDGNTDSNASNNTSSKRLSAFSKRYPQFGGTLGRRTTKRNSDAKRYSVSSRPHSGNDFDLGEMKPTFRSPYSSIAGESNMTGDSGKTLPKSKTWTSEQKRLSNCSSMEGDSTIAPKKEKVRIKNILSLFILNFVTMIKHISKVLIRDEGCWYCCALSKPLYVSLDMLLVQNVTVITQYSNSDWFSWKKWCNVVLRILIHHHISYICVEMYCKHTYIISWTLCTGVLVIIDIEPHFDCIETRRNTIKPPCDKFKRLHENRYPAKLDVQAMADFGWSEI